MDAVENKSAYTMQITDTYCNNVVRQWNLKEPIQFYFIIFNNVLQQHNCFLMK